MKFVDQVEIIVQGGKGGSGCVSFQREKYRPYGGPDGGNGGKGGNISIQPNPSLPTLFALLVKKKYVAPSGQPGRGRNQSGKKGEDLIIHVPLGTQIYDPFTRRKLADLFRIGENYLAATGGRGGLGNTHFVSSVQQTPRYAQPGEATQSRQLFLELSLLADVGLIGLPNAGKSTLLSAVSNSRPKIADYPFTTLIPNLAVVEGEGYRRLYLADIPGIIEGASQGEGLGLSFLKHIERVGVIVYVLDGKRLNFVEEILLLRQELESYSHSLLEKPFLIVVNKVDLFDYQSDMIQEIQDLLVEKKILGKEILNKKDTCRIHFLSAKEKKGIEGFRKSLFLECASQTFAEKMLSCS